MTAAPGLMEKMWIEWECTRLVNRFNQLNDVGDFEAAAELFAPDGSYLTPLTPEPVAGRAAILEMLRQRPSGTFRHFVTNVVIDVQSSVEARGKSYLIVAMSSESDPLKAVADRPPITGEVDEHFILTPEGWRLGHRRGHGGISFG